MGNTCFCVSKVSAGSPVGLAMASNFRSFNLKTLHSSSNLSALSSSPIALPVSWWKRRLCTRRVGNFAAIVSSSSSEYPAISRAAAASGLKAAIVSYNRTYVIKRQWSSDRLEHCCILPSHGALKHGLGKIRGTNAVSAPLVFTTTEGPVDLSFESSSGQVNGDADTDQADGILFPRGGNSAAFGNFRGEHATSHDTQTQVMAELEDALGFPLGQDPQSPSPKPLVIVISGPSGVGKDAVIKRLQHVRGDLHFVVTATTRAMRPGEIDGVDYFFMSRSEFQEMIENHELLEHAIVYGDYKGIPKQQVRESMNLGMDVVLRVDVQGAATVRSLLGQEAVFIFLVAESEKALVKRLIERKTETMDKMLMLRRRECSRSPHISRIVSGAGALDHRSAVRIRTHLWTIRSSFE
ncbi:hypothetical protein R1sor_002629 [Riccia sorocarpa]|uniref:Guanylate kinase-like domain-containing protein n=1 Tax=Riccia sorocarpa TaxID=122646 RepID=A0ABD3H2F7_9MARC